MGKQKYRYWAWVEAEMNAWLSGDVDSSVACFAEDCSRKSIDPFGQHKAIQGHRALREAYEEKAADWTDKMVIAFEVLSANKDRGINHSWKSWTNKEGQAMACSYISIVKLDIHNKCTDYSEWNVSRAEGE